MNRVLAIILLFFTQLCGLSLIGQKYFFFNYDVDNGFPQANANSLAQDKDGFLWIATQIGVVRFDGKNYEVYNRKNGCN